MNKNAFHLIIFLCGVCLVSSLWAQDANLSITSSAFLPNHRIPAKYTCDGKNINPPIDIANIPDETKSLVLIIDDPDAPFGTWDHWILYNISLGSSGSLSIDEGRGHALGTQGKNDFGDQAYGGPCPPFGKHRYIFKIYAIDVEMNLPDGLRKKEVEDQMKGHVIAKSLLRGLYQKKH